MSEIMVNNDPTLLKFYLGLNSENTYVSANDIAHNVVTLRDFGYNVLVLWVDYNGEVAFMRVLKSPEYLSFGVYHPTLKYTRDVPIFYHKTEALDTVADLLSCAFSLEYEDTLEYIKENTTISMFIDVLERIIVFDEHLSDTRSAHVRNYGCASLVLNPNTHQLDWTVKGLYWPYIYHMVNGTLVHIEVGGPVGGVSCKTYLRTFKCYCDNAVRTYYGIKFVTNEPGARFYEGVLLVLNGVYLIRTSEEDLVLTDVVRSISGIKSGNDIMMALATAIQIEPDTITFPGKVSPFDALYTFARIIRTDDAAESGIYFMEFVDSINKAD